MQRELGFSTTELTGAFSVALFVSGIAGIAVGRHLDRHGPRTLMTLGSIAAAGLVLAWSQVDGLAAFYAVWTAIGLVMAAVLYEPAFTILAKHDFAQPPLASPDVEGIDSGRLEMKTAARYAAPTAPPS